MEMNIPHLFRCPISLDLFTDPVTLCTGQTYDRHSIKKWLEVGNRTCPVTMQPLYDTTLVPNHTLQHLIEQWLLTNPSPSADMEMSLTTIRSILESESSAADSKIDMLKMVRFLSIESDVNQARLIHLGFFPLLVELIFQPPMDLALRNVEMLEISLDCVLLLLPSSHLGCLNEILTKDDRLISLELLLSEGSGKIKISLCCLLEKIALSEETQELSLIIGQLPHVMQSLVAILGNNADTLASDACVRAINGLCSREANRQNALRDGVVHALINYLSNNSTEKCESSKALATMECLFGQEIEKSNLTKIDNLVRILVKHIFVVLSGNEGSEYAISLLLTMCRDSAWACDEAVNAGVVTQLLCLIQSQCSASTKTKAINLLKLLRLNYIGCDERP